MLERILPSFFFDLHLGPLALWQVLGLILAMPLSGGVGLALARLALRIAARAAARTRAKWDDAAVAAMSGPAQLLVAALLFDVSMQLLRLTDQVEESVRKLLTVLFLGAAAWLALRMVAFAATTLEAVVGAKGSDELKLRGLRTQIAVLQRIAMVVVVLVAGSLMLLQFDVVRSVGVSLLASAGVAGIVLGLAAQKSIATLLAGIQLSLTQPMRIGDTLIIEGEWGWVEEITLTYVVVKVWDQRRLVVPIHKFLDNAFQNWTKVAPELLGTVFLYTDFALPVEAVRQALSRVLEGNPRWDGRVQGVQVTNLTDRTMEVRALVSAADADKLWDLRCEVREKLMAWLRDFEAGRYLPRTRIDAPNTELVRSAAG
ncbi:MAG: mechanosensitive ion channel [Deltaproteobacteria bacterium]|nr:mechanosensitive ion channel [Deltaproteobacteria bacterium]